MERRDFIKTTALASGIGMIHASNTSRANQNNNSKNSPYVGVQIAPHSFYDEGVEYCLDLLKETGEINALMISSLAYYGAMGRPKELMADHGVPIVDNTKRTLPRVWVKHHEAYYKDTSLRHMKPDPSWTFYGKEIYSTLSEPAHKRGIKVYERMYEPSKSAVKYIHNFESVLETTIFGNTGDRPCMNNPDYRAWLVGSMQDLFEHYDLDGIQYGAERSGPLSDFLAWNRAAGCFCEHCTSKAKKADVDAEQAKKGLIEIHDYVMALKKDSINPTDGIFTEFLRIIMRYPAVLAWENLWYQTANDLHYLIYQTVKAVKPTAQVGRHIDHQQSSYALLFRAGADYRQMTDSNDFIKLILYHDIAGPRVLGKINNLRKHMLGDLSPSLALNLYYSIFGYDPQIEAPADKMVEKGLSPHYVYRETKRAVDRVDGQMPIYAGIGLDIPKGGGWGTGKWQSDPEEVYKATKLAFDAGAGGVVASREYEEITLESLGAMGKAIRDFKKG